MIELSPSGILSLVVAGAMLLLAGGLLYIDFNNRIHRAFAVLLLMRALAVGTRAFGGAFDSYASRVSVYYLLAIPFVALYFVYVYRQRYHGSHATMGAGRGWIPGVLLAGWIGVEIAYLMDHGLYRTIDTFGPLHLFENALMISAFAFIALLLARDALRTADVVPRRSRLFAAAGFALEPVYRCASQFTDAVLDTARAGGIRFLFLELDRLGLALAVGLLGVLAAQVLYRIRHTDDAVERTDLQRFLVPWLLPLASAALVLILIEIQGTFATIKLIVIFDKLWILALPLLVSYALVKYRFLEIDLKLKFVVRQSTVAAVFAGLFWVASEVLESFVDISGLMWGVLAAAAIVLALKPIQWLAQGVTERLLPTVEDTPEYRAERRLHVYRAAVDGAHKDQRITAAERDMLDHLRDELGLTGKQAAAIERQAAVAAQASGAVLEARSAEPT